jgi:hypothetical protein
MIRGGKTSVSSCTMERTAGVVQPGPRFPNWRIVNAVLRERLRLTQSEYSNDALGRFARRSNSIGDFFLRLDVPRLEAMAEYWLSALVLLLWDADSDVIEYEHDYLEMFGQHLQWAARVARQWGMYTRSMHVYAWDSDPERQAPEVRLRLEAKRLVEHFTWLMLYPRRPSRDQLRMAREGGRGEDRMEQEDESSSTSSAEAELIRGMLLQVPHAVRAQRYWLLTPFFATMRARIEQMQLPPFIVEQQLRAHWVDVSHDMDSPYFFVLVQAEAFAVPNALDPPPAQADRMKTQSLQQGTYLYVGSRQWPSPIRLDLPQLLVPIRKVRSMSMRQPARVEADVDGHVIVSYVSSNARTLYRERLSLDEIDALYRNFNPLLAPHYGDARAEAEAEEAIPRLAVPEPTVIVARLDEQQPEAGRLADINLSPLYDRFPGQILHVLDHLIVENNWIVVVSTKGLSVHSLRTGENLRLRSSWQQQCLEAAAFARAHLDETTAMALQEASDRLGRLLAHAEPELIRVHLAAQSVGDMKLELLVGLDVAKVNPASQRPLLFFRFVLELGLPLRAVLAGDAILFDANELHRQSMEGRPPDRARFAQLGRLVHSCGRLQLEMIVTARGDRAYDHPAVPAEAGEGEEAGIVPAQPTTSRLNLYLSWRAVFRNPIHARNRYVLFTRRGDRTVEIFSGLPDPETTQFERLPAYDPLLPPFQMPLYAGQEYSLEWRSHLPPTQFEPGTVYLAGLLRVDRLRHQRRVSPQRLLYELVHVQPPPNYAYMSDLDPGTRGALSQDDIALEQELSQFVPYPVPTSRDEMMFGTFLVSDAHRLAEPLAFPEDYAQGREEAQEFWRSLNERAKSVRETAQTGRLTQYSWQTIVKRETSMLEDQGLIPAVLQREHPSVLAYFDRAAPILQVTLMPLDPELLAPSGEEDEHPQEDYDADEQDVRTVPRRTHLSAVRLVF